MRNVREKAGVVPKLLDIRMHDGSRHFGSLPFSRPWHEFRRHLARLEGAQPTGFVGDDHVEAWLDFDYGGHHFSVNNQLGEYWFFVRNPSCPDDVLLALLNHFAQLPDRGGSVRPKSRLLFWSMAVVVIGLAVLGLLRLLETHIVESERQYVSRLTLEGLRLALESFYRDSGRFPSELESLAILAERGDVDRKNLTDLWGTAMLYRVIDAETVTVVSLGADGAAGGTGFNEDLTATVKAPSKPTTELTFTSTQP